MDPEPQKTTEQAADLSATCRKPVAARKKLTQEDAETFREVTGGQLLAVALHNDPQEVGDASGLDALALCFSYCGTKPTLAEAA